METGIQHIIDKLEQAMLALGEKANVKPVVVSSQQMNQQTNRQTNQQKRDSNQECHIVAVVTFPMSVRSTKLSMQEKIELWL